MAKIELVKRVKYAGDIHKKLVELGWDLDTAAMFCDNLPDADVAPVRHGEWFDVGSLSCRCSECGCKNNRETPWCPNCGARMDGGADNGE